MQAAAAHSYGEEGAGELYLRLARELELLRQRAAHLEQTLCAASLSRFGEGSVRELQDIDHILQHLGALRDFLSALATTAPSVGAIELTSALARIRLAELQRRLSGDAELTQPDECVVSGECEMF